MTYYVLMCHGDPSHGVHLVTCKKYERAKSAVRWQGAVVPSPTYPICKYDPVSNKFLELHGARRKLILEIGPYKEEAFEEFKASLPVAP